MIIQFWLLESIDHAAAAVMFAFLKSSFLKSYHWDSGYFNCHFKCWVEWKSWQTQRMFESIPNVTGRYHCMDTWEEHTWKTKVKFICQVIYQGVRTLSVLICDKQHSWNYLYSLSILYNRFFTFIICYVFWNFFHNAHFSENKSCN